MIKAFKFYFPNKKMADGHFLVTDRYINQKYFGYFCYLIQGISTILYLLNSVNERIDVIVFNVYMIMVFIAIFVSELFKYLNLKYIIKLCFKGQDFDFKKSKSLAKFNGK